MSASDLKLEAKRLRPAIEAMFGHPVSNSQALELVAKAHAYPDWNTASAVAGPAKTIDLAAGLPPNDEDHAEIAAAVPWAQAFHQLDSEGQSLITTLQKDLASGNVNASLAHRCELGFFVALELFFEYPGDFQQLFDQLRRLNWLVARPAKNNRLIHAGGNGNLTGVIFRPDVAKTLRLCQPPTKN